jgi:hypothetical protein
MYFNASFFTAAIYGIATNSTKNITKQLYGGAIDDF